jgi:ABC-2 type transport system permease protein
VWLGRLDVTETLGYFALGLGWTVLLALLLALLWHRASSRITVQGG